MDYEQAAKLVVTGEVQTFRQECNYPAVWQREVILEAMRAARSLDSTGPLAQALGFGVALLDDFGWLFVQTDQVIKQ